MKTRISAVALFTCIIVCAAPSASLAQSACKCIEDSFAQTSCGRRGAAAPTAQELIVKRDIQERIDQTIEADQAKDVEAAVRFDMPGFTVKNLDGSTDMGADAKKGIKQGYDHIYIVSDETYAKIDCLTLNGKEATVYVNQHFVRTMPDRKNGSPHEVITNITHRETWIYTEQGWMRSSLVELPRGPSFLNGQPFDPGN